MKINFLLIVITIALFSSCSTSYKTGQTPDDVYYSPARPVNDYVRTNNEERHEVYDNTTSNSTIYVPSDDYEIRRRVHNRRYRRYGRYDDYNYPYGYNNGYNNGVYVDPKTQTKQTTSQPRKYNLGVYKNNTATNNSTQQIDAKTGKPINNSSTTTAPANTGSGVGNFIRKITRSENNSYNNNNNTYQSGSNNNSNTNTPSRTFEPRTSNTNSSSSSSGSSSGSSSNNNSSSGGNAPVRVFK